MEDTYQSVITLAVSLAIGLLVGIERSWSDRDGKEGSRIAGLRTFSLIGLLGGVAVLLGREVGVWFVGVAFIGVAALSITAHVLDVQEDQDLGTTTTFSMMLVFALAAWAAYGAVVPAMAVTVVVIALLGYKPVLHSWLQMISPQDFFAGAKLLIISVVLLPLLPNQGYGPWQALNPFWTWLMVVLISGLSFLGYVGMKIVGERAGLIMTAIVGALASSTAVTVSLARLAKQRQHYRIFAGGVLLASAIMFLRVMIEIFIVSPGLLALMWLPLSMMCVGILLACATNTLVKGIMFATIAGTRQAIRLPVFMGAAMLPGLLVALLW